VLTKVSRIYLSGAIEFYAKLPNDPWQKAHDDLEEAINDALKQEDYAAHLTPAVAQFEATLVELIEKYRPFAPNQPKSAIVTGFMSNSPEEFALRDSMITKSCAMCGTKEDVKIKNHPKSGLGVFCRGCFQKK
jgi:hypothetical protein